MVAYTYIAELVKAYIPKDYWWLNIDDLEVDKADIAFCKNYMNKLDKAKEHALGVLFHGPNGIGKTSMQCMIGKEAIVYGYTVRYFTAQQYIEAKKQKSELLEYYESADFILFDELDKVYISRGSNFVLKTLEDFIRRMTSLGKVLIICTNSDEEYLNKTFGASTMSVLRRHLGFLPVEGTDYSGNMQDRWHALLQSDRDYLSDSILSIARRRMERELQEDKREWEKTYR
jgi:DNA replication protein DnaC